MKDKKISGRESKAHPKDGKRLRSIRRKNGRSQTEFAAEFNISTGTIRNYESGKTEMPPSFWRAVLLRYGENPVPPDPDQDPIPLMKPSLQAQQTPAQSKLLLQLPVFIRLRAKSIYLKDNVHSALRRRLEWTMHTIFVAASLTFVGEQILRYLTHGLVEPTLYRDIVFASSFLVVLLLLVPISLSIPWGIKVDPNNEAT